MRRSAKAASALIIAAAAASAAYAAPGTYTQLSSGGLWSDPANWSGSTVADGSGNLADLSTLNITADNTVHLDSARTIGSLTFGDTTASHGWVIDNNASATNVLTLAGTTPTITVGTLATNKSALISAELAGTAGLTKAGAGTLVLSGTNTYSGGTAISGGLLQIGNGGTTGTLGIGTVNIAVSTSGTGLAFKRSDTITVSNAITGSGGRLSQNGTGILILTGANTYSGPNSIAGGATLQGADETIYTGSSQNVRTVFGSGIIAPGGTSTLQLRANGLNDGTTQSLNFVNGIQASGGGQNLTIDVDRQGGTGTNKAIGLSILNCAVPVGGTTTINVTGANGYSLKTTGSNGVTLGGGTATGSLKLNPTSANLIVAGNVSNSGSGNAVKTLVLDGTSTGNEITGAIGDQALTSPTAITAITKSGTSTWTLSGNSTYTGATLITGGKLVVNGSLAAGSAVTVNGASAILGGSGTIGGPVTLTAGSIAPGNSAGQLNLTGGLTVGASGIYLAEINNDSKDLLAIGGNLDLSASGDTLDVTLTGTQAQSRYVLATYTGTRSGVFDNLLVHGGAGNWQQDYSVAGEIAIVVPEPTTASLLAGVFMLGLARRRRA